MKRLALITLAILAAYVVWWTDYDRRLRANHCMDLV